MKERRRGYNRAWQEREGGGLGGRREIETDRQRQRQRQRGTESLLQVQHRKPEADRPEVRTSSACPGCSPSMAYSMSSNFARTWPCSPMKAVEI